MRGLSVQQPWSSLLAIGAKVFETRSWSTSYRGLVAIHSSAEFPGWCRTLTRVSPFSDMLAGVRGELPLGQILAVGALTACHRITERFERELDRVEHAFGDYTHGRYAFEFSAVRLLKRPFPYKGRLGFWTIPPETEVRIRLAAGLA